MQCWTLLEQRSASKSINFKEMTDVRTQHLKIKWIWNNHCIIMIRLGYESQCIIFDFRIQLFRPIEIQYILLLITVVDIPRVLVTMTITLLNAFGQFQFTFLFLKKHYTYEWNKCFLWQKSFFGLVSKSKSPKNMVLDLFPKAKIGGQGTLTKNLWWKWPWRKK